MARIHPQSMVKRWQVLRSRQIVHWRSYKGQIIYASKWPIKRGKPKSKLQKAWVDNFTLLAKRSKNSDPCALIIAQELAAKTGWFYRDVLETALSGKLIYNSGNRGRVGPIPRIFIDQPDKMHSGAPRVTTPTVSVIGGTPVAVPVGSCLTLGIADTEWDNNSFWNRAAGDDFLEVKSSGLYFCFAEIEFNTLYAYAECIRMLLNGTQEIANNTVSSANNLPGHAQIFRPWYFVAGDTVQLCVETNFGGPTARIKYFGLVGMTPEAII